MIDNDKLIIMRSGTWEGLVLFYNTIFSDRGWTLPPHMIPVAQALMDKRIDNLAIIVGPGSTKSTLLSIVYPTYVLGLDPSQTILGISAGEFLITGFMRAAMEIIEFSAPYKAIFPDTRPDKGAGWSTERGMFVTNRKPGISDASYWGAGVSSKALVGKHAKTILMDDLHDSENSRSVTGRETLLEIYRNTIIGRADPSVSKTGSDSVRFIIAGRRWHQDDIYGVLEREGNYVVMTLPAERPDSNFLYWDCVIPDGMVCCFNEEKGN